MMNLSPIHKFIDYVLLEAASTSHCGLYDGKAGMSLCLFEISRMFRDSYIEDMAFRMMQECILQKENDISFERGISGRGFAFLYLIRNKFLEADFEELFGDKIRKVFECIERKELKDIRVVYFLFLASEITGKNIYKSAMDTIVGGAEAALIADFENCKNTAVPVNKTKLLEEFNNYLKSMHLLPRKAVNNKVLASFVDVYKKNFIIDSLYTGYYMKPYSGSMADKIITAAAGGLYPDAMFIADKINVLYLLHSDAGTHASVINSLEKSIEDSFGDTAGKHLLRGISPLCSYAGYGFGISRLLLYQVFLHDRKKGFDTMRFQYVF